MSLNEIATDVLAEKQAAKPEAEPRLCKCGCLAVLTRKPNEAHRRFKSRKYHTRLLGCGAHTSPQAGKHQTHL